MENLKRIIQQTEKLKASPPTVYDQQYLLGFRGLLVIETFLHVFLQTFVPVAVATSANPDGRLYQKIIRKTLSVVFWNEYFLYGAIIFLSARSIAIPFIRSEAKDRSSRIARSVLCRSIALSLPVAVSLAICKLAFTHKNLDTISQFKDSTGNKSIEVPYFIPNTLAYFNSVFNLFWTSHDWLLSSGSTAFPSQTLWMINAVYVQSYTVYMTMIIIPYTRKKWRVQTAFGFIITAWWVQSWAWFTISGLLFCDMVMNMDFQGCAQRGIPINIPHQRFQKSDGSPRPLRVPVWIPAGFCLAAGFFMQFAWAAWRPDLFDKEYEYHTGLYYTAGLNYEYKTHHTYARDDIYLILIGFFTFLEAYSVLQRIFENKLFVYLGKRSLSYFLIQSIIIYTAGIKVFTQTRQHDGANFPSSTIAALVTCLVTTIPAAELFYRLVELPSKVLAHRFFDILVK
ncbi:hypothetical protein LHYA1_G008195 [Lachnellula hyalina]|uniref:Acyltransferase 3 domain-containing protein n=1 Tax=Lachnellula hyalina TaxID=1316788 RepID=A0A8H8TVG8_9HELO|nr:uncharacterized protein LHYA1_G008195 [Lachnellula hyalina]TVY23352.1 hypothetical protein LHYA1_G008195 [Lachnellula hyalina]